MDHVFDFGTYYFDVCSFMYCVCMYYFHAAHICNIYNGMNIDSYDSTPPCLTSLHIVK